MDVEAVLARYVHATSAEELAAASEVVQAHLERVARIAETKDFVDVRLARALSVVLLELVADAEQYTARERALLAGAVRYFAEHDDINSDLTSPTGFEDDAEVLNAVCAFLGRSDLVVLIDGIGG